MAGEGENLSEILEESDLDEEMMPPAGVALGAFASASSSDDSGYEEGDGEDDEGSDQDEEMMPAAPESSVIASSTASAATPPSSGDEDLCKSVSHLQCEDKPTKAIASDKLLELFGDFKERRAGILKALTTEFKRFYSLCDPAKENLCLYGLPDETWDVNVPPDEAPPDMPEPVSGINYIRRAMGEKEWLVYVAEHSDVWLLALTFYSGAESGLDQESRRLLFEMINDLPTIQEVVKGAAKVPTNETSPKNSSKSNKSASPPPSHDVEATACSSKRARDR